MRFPAGTGSIHFENVSCVGNEESILSCNYTYVGKDSECSHEDDLGIICEDGKLLGFFFRLDVNGTAKEF